MPANAWIWAVFIVAVALIWLKLNQRRFGDMLSPFNLLFFGWVGPLLLRGMNLSSLERPWSAGTCFLIGWTTVVLTGCSYFRKRVPGFEKESSRRMWRGGVIRVLEDPMVGRVVLATFAISFAAYIYNEFVRNPIGVPLIALHNDPTLLGEAFHVWGKPRESRSWGLYVSIPIYLESALLYMIGRVRPKKDGKWWIMLSALYPIMSVLKLARTDLIITLTAFIVAEYYFDKFSAGDGRREQSPVRIMKKYPYLCATLLTIFAGVLLATQFEQLRGGVLSSDAFQQVVGTDIHVYQPADNFLAEAYEYFAMPWENFESTYNTFSSTMRLGVGSFRPVFSLLGRGQAVDDLLDGIGFDPHTGPANTYPFITLQYMELGVVGVILGPIVYALFVNAIYSRFRGKPNFLNFCLYLHMPFAWMWLFSSFAFSGLHFYLMMVYLWGIDVYYRKYCIRRDSQFPGVERIGVLPSPTGQGVE
ncbi:MAG: oligosaccharide repeat unit polymerase [Acidobacteriia bacterium]|nr:oligosaccharide repeat unit polymerase [Terriglobia bacterium]